jgi:hypothetical protein
MKMKKLAVLIIGTMLFLNLHAGLVTHLEFEDDFKDRYGNNDGLNGPIDETGNHDVSFDTGKEGRAIYFDGNDYIEVGENDFDTREIVYTIEKDGTARMKYIFMDKEERLIKTVSMEANYEGD